MSVEGKLVLSSNRGRYAVGSVDGVDLTSGDSLEVYLGGRWVSGSVESAPIYSIEKLPHEAVKGYYFADNEGNRCGLCVGMLVRAY